MPDSQPLCDFCKYNPATVFVTRVVNHNAAPHHASIQRLCADCARRHATGKNWLQTDAALLSQSDSPGSIALDDVVKELFQQMKKSEENSDSPSAFDNSGADFSSLEFDDDEEDESFDADLSAEEMEHLLAEINSVEDADADDSPGEGVLPLPHPGPVREVVSARCSKCGTTWDRLRQDGRAGCAHCYACFHEKLVAVMEKMQRHSHHTGKLPRAALKRQRRLEQLRTKRDHRLEMLKRRLEEAVTDEKYEEAAQLRDKIKIVVSTIVGND